MELSHLPLRQMTKLMMTFSFKYSHFCEGLFSKLLANSMSKYLPNSFFRSNAHASFIRKRKTIQGLGLPGLQQKTQACNEKKVQRQAHTMTALDIGRTR